MCKCDQMSINVLEALQKTLIENAENASDVVIALHNVLCHGTLLEKVFGIDWGENEKNLETIIDGLKIVLEAMIDAEKD